MNLYDLIDLAVGGITRDDKAIALVDSDGLVQIYMLTGMSGVPGKVDSYEDDWTNVDTHDPRPEDGIARPTEINNKELRNILDRYLYPYYVVRHQAGINPATYEAGREGKFETERDAAKFIVSKYPHNLGGLRIDLDHLIESGGAGDWQYGNTCWSIVERVPVKSEVYSA